MGAPEPQRAFDADRDRGIRNASTRFKERRAAELTSADLIRKGERGKYQNASNDPSYGRDTDSRAKQAARTERFDKKPMSEELRLNEELARLGKEGELPYEEADSRMLLENAPEKPQFPTIMFTLAVLKDILDAADATVVFIVITTVLSFVISLVLFFWILGKMGGGWWKRKIIKKLWVKWGIATIIEFIPLGKIIPATTIFVLMVHYDESKIVKVLNGALGRMR